MLLFRNGATAMLPVEAGVAMHGLCEPSAEAWIPSPVGRCERRGRGVAALARTPLAARFVCWQGLSLARVQRDLAPSVESRSGGVPTGELRRYGVVPIGTAAGATWGDRC
jgi:hypothetical protein